MSGKYLIDLQLSIAVFSTMADFLTFLGGDSKPLLNSCPYAMQRLRLENLPSMEGDNVVSRL